jgi:hypothetical protein
VECGINSDGKHEVVLFRSFDVNEYIDFEGINLNAGAEIVLFWMECHSTFDGTRIVLGIQLFYKVGLTMYKRGFINVIVIDSGCGTQFVRHKVDFIDGICVSPVDNRFAAICGRWGYVCDIDVGPDEPLFRFQLVEALNMVPFGYSKSLFLDTANDSMIRRLLSGVISYNLEDGVMHSRVTLPTVRAITLSLTLQRIAVSSETSVTLFEIPSCTQVISWGDGQPMVSMNQICHYLEFGPGSTDLLGCYPARTIVIWNSSTAEMIRCFNDSAGLRADALSWCDVGKIMIADSLGNVRILDSTSGEELLGWKAHVDDASVCRVHPPINILL